MTSTETPMVDTWQPGELRRGRLLLRLSDGTEEQITATVMILDVRPGHDIRTVRILWAQWVPLTDTIEGPHVHDARWQLTDAGTGDPAEAGPMTVYLRGIEGHYEPRDPAYNSLEILRDGAIATVARREEHRAAHRPAEVGEAATAAERAEAEAEAARAHRDRLIRDALAGGMSAIDLATTTGLRRARIYQIRDGHRGDRGD